MTTPARTTTTPEPTSLVRAPVEALVPVVEQSTAAAAAMARTQIEARFTVALHRPRNWVTARARILDACARPRFAEDARYRIPRGKAQDNSQNYIEGLSVRFAEEVTRALGNIHVEARVTFDDLERRIISVTTTDLETNVTWPFEVVVEKFVERQKLIPGREVLSERHNSQNQRVYKVAATDDEVLMKQNALVSKAARNGILRFLPSDIQEEALEAIAKALQAEAAAPSNADKRRETLARLTESFAEIGVELSHVEGFLGHKLDTMTQKEYVNLRGLVAAIRDGETTWEEASKTVPATSLRQDAKGVRSEGYAEPGTTTPREAPAGRASVPAEVREVKPPTPRPAVADPYLAGAEAIGGRRRKADAAEMEPEPGVQPGDAAEPPLPEPEPA